MRYLSVCSGIEAASVAWHPLGWRPVAFSEIDAFPSAVLAEPTAALVKRLKYLARRGDLPGACKIGSRWFCDLTKFDLYIAANDAPPAAPAVSLKDLVARARAERSASS